MATPTPLRDDSNAASTDDQTQRFPDNLTHPAANYCAEIAEYDDAPDECTIFPADATEWELVTHWITAAEGTYVSLAAMR